MLCFWDGVPPPLNIGVASSSCRSRQCFFLLWRLSAISRLRVWRCLFFQKRQCPSQQRLRKQFHCLLPRCRNLPLRVSNPWGTRWGDRTRKAWAQQRSLLFLVPVRESFMCAPLLFARLVVCGRTSLAFCTSYLRVLACASIGPVTWPCFLHNVSGILLLPVTKAGHALERGSGRMHSLCHVSFIRRSHLLLPAFSWGDSGRRSLLWPLRLRVRAYCN